MRKYVHKDGRVLDKPPEENDPPTPLLTRCKVSYGEKLTVREWPQGTLNVTVMACIKYVPRAYFYIFSYPSVEISCTMCHCFESVGALIVSLTVNVQIKSAAYPQNDVFVPVTNAYC